ncbi:MAG TPA: cation diffusion facilitator family transporter [Opitutaceae bacterium]|nr:cation diffusion facilitator family transporter [Opitutaceae bacterium]
MVPADLAARADRSARLVLRGVLLNTALAGLKLATGLLGRSQALVADGVESLLDIFSSLLVWGGFRIAARPPDADHPYGHGKAEPLAALIVSLFIFYAAGWIGLHSVRGILHPRTAPHWATLVVLVAVVAVKEVFARRMRAAGQAVASSALKAEAWHHRSDALTSAAAFVGISIALLGGRGYESADAWAALAACLVIAYNGVGIARGALVEVMDTAAWREVEDAVRAVAAGVPGVRRVEKCRVLKSGLGYLVDIHVHVDGALSVREGHEIARAVKFTLLRSPLAVTDVAVHVEPADPPA